MARKVLISGITGQDGAYLAHFLAQKGYEVHGIVRRSSLPNFDRLDILFNHRFGEIPHQHVKLHHGDLTDTARLIDLVATIRPQEIYNLGAQSHVAVSFESPEYTANVDALGALRLLEAIRIAKLEETCRFYQASTSELYGLVQEIPQKETTPFYPRSPYAVAKLYAYWITINYREAYNLFACNGILFNHESCLRGETFVTRKITRTIARIVLGLENILTLGNLDAKRDWGHALDYVEMQWMILQQAQPDDYVIASGTQYSVRTFVDKVAAEYGISLEWTGSGVNEKGIVVGIDHDKMVLRLHKTSPFIRIGMPLVQVSPQFFRPAEVETLLGDASKAQQKLGWTPKISFEALVKEMVDEDFKNGFDEMLKQRIFSKESPLSLLDTLQTVVSST